MTQMAPAAPGTRFRAYRTPRVARIAGFGCGSGAKSCLKLVWSNFKDGQNVLLGSLVLFVMARESRV